jgi:hypothetical protein
MELLKCKEALRHIGDTERVIIEISVFLGAWWHRIATLF